MVPTGFKFAGTRCGIKTKRNDLGIILSDRPAHAAGILTTNQVRAACVDHTRCVLENGWLRAIVVNSGNANCCTGEQGKRDCARTAELAAEACGVSPSEVAVGSTGVIGHPLDMKKVQKGVADAARKFGDDPRPFMDAILTTDLVEKWSARTLDDATLYSPSVPLTAALIEGIYGVAKGSGMMAPNMATMLSYIVSDLDASELDLPSILKRVGDRTFNCMTVDGDTSTNDMVLLLCNGASGRKPGPDQFEQALTDVCLSLAKQIARDGEGATKLVEVRVTGSSDPRRIARTIAESPLVKTAMFGCDPNWGRLLMAAGRAGVPFKLSDVRLTLTARDEQAVLFENSAPGDFDRERVSSSLKADHVVVDLNLGPGETATIYTCDLGYGYVRINAEYHT